MTERPVYVDLLPPCNCTCPAGEDIQGWMAAADRGDYETAWRKVVQNNPLPAIIGRVCYHPCESQCNRAHFDDPVNIHAVERFIGDQAIHNGWQFDPAAPSTGKHILIVGSGPAGLSAAYHLRRLGHAVTIYEAADKPGGMLRWGIPQYRLPRNILDAEIARIEQMGVTIKLGTKLDDLSSAMQQFDAVFLAIGAQLAKRTEFSALDAITMLRDVESGVTPALGRRVLVYGGGNTALDVARTAKRLGAAETLIIYRRTREKMPAQEFEIQEAIEEGVMFKWLSTIKCVGEDFVTIEKTRLDDQGLPQATGEYERIPGGTIILALGQDVDRSFLKSIDLTQPGVFCGGDMVATNRTATVAIGHGKKEARRIDAWLRAESSEAAAKHPLASYDRLNTRYYHHAPRATQDSIEMERRATTFDEVHPGLDEAAARSEAARCCSCGNCNECDNCYEVCPGDAVVKLGPGKRFKFNYENCDSCGLCAEECPCGAIQMQVN